MGFTTTIIVPGGGTDYGVIVSGIEMCRGVENVGEEVRREEQIILEKNNMRDVMVDGSIKRFC